MEDVRQATTDDVPRLVELVELQQTTCAADGALSRSQPASEARKTLEDALGRDDRLVLVGTVDGYIAGLALAMIGKHEPNERVADVEIIFVEPPFRDLGLGEGLVTAVAVWARENRCVEIELRARPGDRNTKSLGERLGFVAQLIVMRKDLK